MTKTASDFQAHVIELARAFNTRVWWTPGYDALYSYADITRRGVSIPFITDDRIYAVALHELGHINSPMGSLIGPRIEAEKERNLVRLIDVLITEEHAAWEWARYYAMVWTPAMQEVMDFTFGSYQQERAMAIEARRTSTMAREKADEKVIQALRTLAERLKKSVE